jgi:glycosyltransferase involved in cell wall biosynthesis
MYHANDWPVLPVAARLAKQYGASYAYDSHEYGTQQLAHLWTWRWFFPPYIRSLEKRYIHDARFISTVGEGIASMLKDDYDLPELPLVIRSVPPYEEAIVREVGERLTVLYHGGFDANRGLTHLIASVPLWEPRFTLLLRGSGAPSEERVLRDLVADLELGDRVTFAPAVPMTDLVRAASEADIGIFSVPSSTKQSEYCLPNKFFEYVMAGLAVCVRDVPEMAALVRRYDLGRLIPGLAPEQIAEAVNGFTRESVARYKANARGAATDLSWEREREVLIGAYASVAAS